jgi:hypothetical protein
MSSQNIRTTIRTISSTFVLLIGRFSGERTTIKHALEEQLRRSGYVPLSYSLDRPGSRDSTETLSTLAHLSAFIIADLTGATSIAQELMTIVPNISIPVQPLLQQDSNEYAMFTHFSRYPWVLNAYQYRNTDELIQNISKRVIDPLIAKASELSALKRSMDE